MIPTDRYCYSGPGNGSNSILTNCQLCLFVVGRQFNSRPALQNFKKW